MSLLSWSTILLIVLVAVSYGEKHSSSKIPKHAVYGFTSFERAFCEHGAHGKGKKDGNYPHPQYCERFITCEHFEHGGRNSKVTTQYCPYGLFFNAKIGVCDWPRNVDCFLYQGKTCFGARRNKFGRFRASQTGYLRSLKLIHVDGYVTCKYYKKFYKSFWGCNAKVGDFKYLVNTWVTTRRNKKGVIFPSKTTPYDPYGNYYLKGYNGHSPYVKWDSDPHHPTKVRRGQQLRIWYGEDLHNIHGFDNKGNHCVEVYALFSYYHPFYFLNRRRF